MAQSSRLRVWFSHRRLLAVETVLLVGLLESLGERYLHGQPDLPNWLKVLFSMLLVIGLFGGLLVILQKLTGYSLKRTHKVVQALPIPTPMLLVHLVVLFALFWVWSWSENLPPW